MKRALEKVRAYYRDCPLYMKISWLHCGIIFGVIVLLMIVITHIASNQQIEDKAQSYQNNLFAVSEKLDMLFANYERDARAIIVNQEYQHTLLMKESSKNEEALLTMKIAAALADFHSSYTRIQTIRFYDWQRQNAYDSLLVSLDDTSSPSWRRVNDFIETGSAYQWTDFVTAEPPNAYLSLLHRVNNYNGKFMGVLELVVSEKQIQRMYSVFEPDDTRVLLVDGAARIVSCSDKTRLGERLDAAVFRDVIGYDDGRSRIVRFDGMDCLVVAKHYGKVGCWLVGVTPRSTVVAGVWLLSWSIVLIGLAGMLTAGVLVRWSSKRSTYPLERILSVIDRVSEGNYGARVILHEQGEYMKLGSQLNAMIDNMVQMMEHIRYQSEQERLYALNSLQMQLNPHFLYNSLETVCGIIESDDGPLAIRMINHISRFYRGVLSGGSATVTLRQEMQITRQYMEIIRIRYRNGFDFDCAIPEEMQGVEVPKMLLQPIVENAIVHGFQGHRDHARIEIRGQVLSERLEVTVADNGRGMRPDELATVLTRDPPKAYDGGGFGLRSIDQRVRLVFGEPFGLRVESVSGVGTRVTVVLPFAGGHTTGLCDK